MKLKFKNQQFQTDAVDSVADLFKGQEKLRSTFEITNIEAIDLINQNELGIGNVISISNDALLANMHEIQRRNNLPSEIKDLYYIYYKRMCRFDFSNFNKLYDSDQLQLFGQAMLDF